MKTFSQFIQESIEIVERAPKKVAKSSYKGPIKRIGTKYEETEVEEGYYDRRRGEKKPSPPAEKEVKKEDFSLNPKSKQDYKARRVSPALGYTKGKDLDSRNKWGPGSKEQMGMSRRFLTLKAAPRKMFRAEDFSLKPKSKEDLAKRDVSHHPPVAQDEYFKRSAKKQSKGEYKKDLKSGALFDKKTKNLKNRLRASGVSGGSLAAAVSTTRSIKKLDRAYGNPDYIPAGHKEKYKETLRKKGIKV